MSEQERREEIVRIVEELHKARIITPTGGNVSIHLGTRWAGKGAHRRCPSPCPKVSG